MEKDKSNLRMFEAKFNRENMLQVSNQSITNLSPVLRRSNAHNSESPLFNSDTRKEDTPNLKKSVILVKTYM